MTNETDPFAIGNNFSYQFEITNEIVESFKLLSKDINPVHVDKAYSQRKGFKDVIVYGNVLGLGVSYLIGMALPMKEVIILKQAFDFQNPMYLNDSIHILGTVKSTSDSVKTVELGLAMTNQHGKKVAKGILLFKRI